MQMYDAQRAMAFLLQQATYIEREVYRIQYPAVRYPDLVPVDTTAPEWVASVTYFSMDGAGAARWFNGNAQDVPRSDVTRDAFQTTVSMAAIGYGYDLSELGHAELVGMPLTPEKAEVARRVAEEFIDRVAMFGDTAKGYVGMVNSPAVTAGMAPADGTGSGTAFATKTPVQITRDFNGMIAGIYSTTNTVEMADTVLLPHTQYQDMASRQYSSTSDLTVLDWLRRTNVYTVETGKPLMIRGVYGLETAGSGGTSRMIAYRRDPSVVKMHMPMPFRFMPPWQSGPIRFEVPGIFRLGGVDVKRPAAFRYLDAI